MPIARACRFPGTLVPVPWQPDVAQVQLTMHEHDGSPFFGDPRHLLANVLARFTRLSLTPVVAIEYEFYLVDIAPRCARPAAAAERPADRPA